MELRQEAKEKESGRKHLPSSAWRRDRLKHVAYPEVPAWLLRCHRREAPKIKIYRVYSNANCLKRSKGNFVSGCK